MSSSNTPDPAPQVEQQAQAAVNPKFKTYQTTEEPPLPDISNSTILKQGMWWTLGGIVLSIASFLYSYGLGIGLLGLTGAYATMSLKIIRDPNMGIVYRWGKRMGKVYHGWYLPPPFVVGIKTVRRNWKTVNIPVKADVGGLKTGDAAANTYDNEESRVDGIFSVAYRPHQEKLQYLPSLPQKEADDRVFASVRARVRNHLGGMKYNQLVANQHGIETALLTEMEADFRLLAYEFSDIDFTEHSNPSQEEARSIRIKGRADAEVDRERAKALSDSLQGNNQAAFVAGMKELAPAFKAGSQAYLESKTPREGRNS